MQALGTAANARREIDRVEWIVVLTTAAGERFEHRLSIAPRHLALFDFDGDGTQELVLSARARGAEIRTKESPSFERRDTDDFGVEIVRALGDSRRWTRIDIDG